MKQRAAMRISLLLCMVGIDITYFSLGAGRDLERR